MTAANILRYLAHAAMSANSGTGLTRAHPTGASFARKRPPELNARTDSRNPALPAPIRERACRPASSRTAIPGRRRCCWRWSPISPRLRRSSRCASALAMPPAR